MKIPHGCSYSDCIYFFLYRFHFCFLNHYRVYPPILLKEIKRKDIKLWSNTFFCFLDKPNGQIGVQVARLRCLKFDLSAIDRSSRKEYPAELLAIKLAEFLVVDGSPENRRYCIVNNKKTLHTL